MPDLIDTLPNDAPPWAEMIYKELCRLRQLAEGAQSLTVGTSEAASILGVSETTVRRLDAEGKMPRKVNTGKHAKYNRTDVERLAKAKKTGRPRKAA